MSFFLELQTGEVSLEVEQRLVRLSSAPDAWPCSVRRSRHGVSIKLPDSVDGVDLLSDDADWDAPRWLMNAEPRARLARTIEVLGALLGEFSFRATWVGSAVSTTVTLTASRDTW
jgi:hypothetical protein